jgi:hypothetical protein
MQLAVTDRRAAADRFAELLGTEVLGERRDDRWGAAVTVLAVGESELDLCEPDGAGAAADFIGRNGEGLLGVGCSTLDPEGLARRVEEQGVAVRRLPGDRFAVEGDDLYGIPLEVGPVVARPRVGLVRFFYEATNALLSDWRKVAQRWTDLFGLDESRFSPLTSERFGYKGTLTLFDPPARLDRIELSEITDPSGAMGRFAARRGDSLYMCYVETDDVEAIRDRLLDRGARFTPRGGEAKTERLGLWVHPRDLHGMLLGVSVDTLAWEWSGRPELVRTPA